MPAPDRTAGTCQTCGTQLEPADDLGCMACLLRVGLDELATNENDSFDPPDQFGVYSIDRRDDGSPWELGRGTMGVTYHALDTSLQRSVALKIINTDLAGRSAEARERFIREARIAAALRHTNVAAVHHFGIREETGQCFCAMELVEGETLEERVRRMGPLDVGTVVEVGCQIAAALVAAEKRGLVHRDLKPANVMITASDEGGKIAVKVIDFGVAKALAETPDARVLTHHGFIGTPAFASPEQFNNAPVDTRSDIYSLGATLWYLLTGQLPFGDRAQQTLGSSGPVAPPINQLKAARVPSRLVALLTSMLAEQPAVRPGVAELATRLETIRRRFTSRGKIARRLVIAGSLGAIAITAALFIFPLTNDSKSNASSDSPGKSIAVLPFENRSEDQQDAFFADGVQDDVRTSLVKVRDIKVIGRSSVSDYREPGKRNLRQIGQQLGVTHVLEGSVQRVANRVLIHAYLTDTRDDRQLWAERYDRTLADSIGLQGELAMEIAVALRARLAPEEKSSLAAKPTDNPDAYLLYLKANERASVIDARTASFIEADQLYDQAIALDPKFAQAYAAASRNNTSIYFFGEQDPARKEKARAQAEAALRISPTLGEAHFAMGMHLFSTEKDYEAGLKELSIASVAAPSNPEILGFTAVIYRRQGEWRKAIATFQRAQELDPRNPQVLNQSAFNFILLRDWASAIACYNRVLAIKPDSPVARDGLSFLEVFRTGDPGLGRAALVKFGREISLAGWDFSMMARDFAGADKIWAELPEETQTDAERMFRQARTALARGDLGSARPLLEILTPGAEAAVRDHPDKARYPAFLGLLYAYLGRKEEAIREARRAVELEPESKNAYHGPVMAAALALVYAQTGEADQAIALIEHLLSVPGAMHMDADGWGSISRAELRLRWEWDPLRSDPRFQKILAGPEPKIVY